MTDISLWNHARIYTEIGFPHCYINSLKIALEATEYASGCWYSPLLLTWLTVVILHVEASFSLNKTIYTNAFTEVNACILHKLKQLLFSSEYRLRAFFRLNNRRAESALFWIGS